MTKRNSEDTTKKILKAALSEFANKGFAGARVDEIAKNAQVNKRMIYYYFKNKQGLYEAVMEKKCEMKEKAVADQPSDPEELMKYWMEICYTDIDFIRLMQWEALEMGWDPVVCEEKRAENFRVCSERIQGGLGQQLEGVGVRPDFLHLCFMAMNWFPLAFPQITRFVTGLNSDQEEFKEAQLDVISHFAKLAVPKIQNP
ncbi:MAG: TetR/AcrR family transcriptional regulator [Candidatus Cloacimonetes bacterium]|nr:TetR/AcrR family transcriptional regulator [Candidatus Cloacimonadota bacterium]